jgi:hypothetical protein
MGSSPLPPLPPLPPGHKAEVYAGKVMAVAAEAMCRSSTSRFPHCMVCSILVCMGAIGSQLADSWATAAAKSSANWSLPWYSSGLLIALALLVLSSLLPGYNGKGSHGSTGEI